MSLSGFGNHFSSEAIPGALPIGRNSPQRPAFGLYAEQLSGTAFTMARAENRRSWLYRLRPSARHGAFTPLSAAENHHKTPANPNRLRWNPREIPTQPTRFIASITPMLVNGDPETAPQQIAIIPRGVRLRVETPAAAARGYLCENHGAPFRLPDLGPIGANGLANPRDFTAPSAWFEDRDGVFELIQKYGDRYWTTKLDHSPLDVVAWHGNLVPMRYDLRHFNALGTVSFDHPDPSIFTVLTSPSAMPGRANADFVIFPPRWLVAEDTFRPPWFHRNLMSEAMGLLGGTYDAKAAGFAPGGLSLHNMMSAHGPDVASWQAATDAPLAPHKLTDTMAFMIESCWPYRATAAAMADAQPGYDAVWGNFPKARLPD